MYKQIERENFARLILQLLQNITSFSNENPAIDYEKLCEKLNTAKLERYLFGLYNIPANSVSDEVTTKLAVCIDKEISIDAFIKVLEKTRNP